MLLHAAEVHVAERLAQRDTLPSAQNLHAKSVSQGAPGVHQLLLPGCG